MDKTRALAERKDQISNELWQQRRSFDDEWRSTHEEHECASKDYAHNGEWFCEHLTMARYRKFKPLIDEADDVTQQLSEAMQD